MRGCLAFFGGFVLFKAGVIVLVVGLNCSGGIVALAGLAMILFGLYCFFGVLE